MPTYDDTKVVITYTADTEKAEAGIKKVNREVDNSTTKTKKAGASWATMAAKVSIAAVAIREVAKYLKEADTAWQNQELSIAKVSIALESVNKGYLTDNIIAYSNELQALTGVGDDVTQSMMAMLIQMGLSEEQTKRITEQAIGLSRVYDISLNEAMKKLVEYEEGNVNALDEMIPALRGATTESEKMASAERILGRAVDGSRKMMDTSAGATIAYDNAVGDLREEIGFLVSEKTTPFRKFWTEVLTRTTQALSVTREYNEMMKELEGRDLTTLRHKKLALQMERERNERALETGMVGTRILTKRNEEIDTEISNLNELIALEDERQKGYAAFRDLMSVPIPPLSDEDPCATSDDIKDSADDASSSEDALAEKIEGTNGGLKDQLKLMLERKRLNDEALLKAGESKKGVTDETAEIGKQADAVGGLKDEYQRLIEKKRELQNVDIETTETAIVSIQEQMNMMADLFEFIARGSAYVGQIVSNMYDGQIQAAEKAGEDTAELQEKQWKAERAWALTAIAFNTASAIMKILSQGGIYAIPLTVMAGAMGIMQAAAVRSQPMPKFSAATGTPPGGYLVPPGYSNDTFPVMAQSGERVYVENNDTEGTPVQFTLVISDDVLGTVNTRLIRNRQTIIRMEDIA